MSDMTRPVDKKTVSVRNDKSDAQSQASIVDHLREEAIAALRPAAFALHREIVQRIPEDLRKSLVGKATPLLIGVRYATNATEMSVAVQAAIEFIQAETATSPSSIDVMHEIGTEFPELGSVTMAMLQGRVTVLMHTTERSVHDRLLDARIGIGGVGALAVKETLEREYGAVPVTVDPWPTSLPLGMLDLVCAKCGTASEAWTLVRKLADDAQDERRGDPTLLDSLHGYGKAMVWARALVRDVEDHRQGRIVWSDVSPGALLVGSPGTGKTTFARNVARAAGLAFFPTSYAAWQSAGTGHLGDVTGAITRVFAQARQAGSALVFIDEVDTLPSRGTSARHEDWWRSVVNTLLEAIDGVDGRSGIVVVGACNDDRNLDPALTRSGRLDRRLEIALPGTEDFARILVGHLDAQIDVSSLLPVAAQAAGTLSGADAARIARDARRLARRAERPVLVEDVIAAMFPSDSRTPSHRHRVAVHEAGHAIVALALGLEPIAASVASVVDDGVGGMVRFDERSLDATLHSDLEDQVTVLLAGRAAEATILGSLSTGSGGSPGSDLARATQIAGAMLGLHGYGTTLSYGTTVEKGPIEALLRRLQDAATGIVKQRRTEVELLAALLTERTILGRDELARFAEVHGSRGGAPKIPSTIRSDVDPPPLS